MRHRRQSYTITALLAAVGLVFAGCSEQSTTQTGPSEAPTTSAQADLSLSASRGSLEGQPGTVFGYDLVAENAGPDAATGVKIEQTFDGSVELVQVSAESGSCSTTGSSFTCAIGTLPTGVSRSVHVVIRIPSASETELSATASSPVADPVVANNSATISAAIGYEGPDPHPSNANPPVAEDDDPLGFTTSVVDPDAIIDNGTVQLGIDQLGQLNVPGGTATPVEGTTDVGLRYVPFNSEATSHGCLCEGWGVGDAGSMVSGYANNSVGTSSNLTVEDFSTTATTAVSTVIVDDGSTDIFRVTHDYHPSSSSNLYEVTITIENISGGTLSDVRYRRVMDWDVEPSAFSEFVTIAGTSAASNVLYASDDGFVTADPLGARDFINFTGDIEDDGPADHGALFDFGFGSLAAGESITFQAYYGAAGDELGALSAVGTVGAEVYSFGQANWDGSGDPFAGSTSPPPGDYGAETGEPNTFIFAFRGVGGDVVVPPGGDDEVCETVDFDELGGHATRLDGFTLDFDEIDLRVKQGGPRSEEFTALYSTDNVGGPDFDLEWNGPRAECPDCEGLGNVLIIPDINFIEHGGQGNSIDGGWIIMNGFTPDVWRFASMTVIDSDATLWDPLTAVHPHFNPYEVSVDGDQIGLSEVTNREGDVQTLVFDEDDSPRISMEARVLIPEDPGAIDNLQFCRERGVE